MIKEASFIKGLRGCILLWRGGRIFFKHRGLRRRVFEIANVLQCTCICLDCPKTRGMEASKKTRPNSLGVVSLSPQFPLCSPHSANEFIAWSFFKKQLLLSLYYEDIKFRSRIIISMNIGFYYWSRPSFCAINWESRHPLLPVNSVKYHQITY